MKIVDNGNKDKSVPFYRLSRGNVFIMYGKVYLKSGSTNVECAVDMETGIIHTILESQDVTPLPKAELYLNK